MQQGPTVIFATNKWKQIKIICVTDITDYGNILLKSLLKAKIPKRQHNIKACPFKIKFLRPTLSITLVLTITPNNCTIEMKTISN